MLWDRCLFLVHLSEYNGQNLAQWDYRNTVLLTMYGFTEPGSQLPWSSMSNSLALVHRPNPWSCEYIGHLFTSNLMTRPNSLVAQQLCPLSDSLVCCLLRKIEIFKLWTPQLCVSACYSFSRTRALKSRSQEERDHHYTIKGLHGGLKVAGPRVRQLEWVWASMNQLCGQLEQAQHYSELNDRFSLMNHTSSPLVHTA